MLTNHVIYPGNGQQKRTKNNLNLHDKETYTAGESYVYTGKSDGEKFAPFGLLGGHDSRTSKMWIKRGNKNIPLHTVDMVEEYPVDIVMSMSPGGGVGDPLNRDVEKVKDDVLNEYISAKIARSVYGVVIDPMTFSVDHAATTRLRKRKAGGKGTEG